jgi:Chlorophyll A-B binding protein
MIAALGLFVAPIVHLPDAVFSTAGGLAEFKTLLAERPSAVYQILLAIAAVEVSTLFKNGQGVAGDLGWDPLDYQKKNGLDSDPAKFEAFQLRELKNGRLAMIGSLGLLLQEVASGASVYGPNF